MRKIIIAFSISLIAGISTSLGSIFTWIKPKNVNDFIGTSLTFSGSMMILISITELIPQGFFSLKGKYNLLIAILCLIIMIIMGILINNLINKKIIKRVGNNSNLYRVGILSMIALMIHNLPEGILTFLSSTINIELGLKLALAISLHNIPEGIAIAIPIYYSTHSHKKVVVGTLISGLSEPIGAILAYLFLYKYLNNTMISIILLLVAGIMISISINEIFEETKKYSTKSIIIGVGISLFILILTNILDII